MANDKDIDFLFEIGSLRHVPRGWRQHLGFDIASDLEHSYRVMWLALIIARMEKTGDEAKIMKMALVHDVAETRVSDLSYVQKVYVTADEEKAADDIFRETIVGDFREVLREYEERESIEAKIVKDADNLDVDIELKELEEQGSKLPQKLADFRKIVREDKFYTESARQLWDKVQNADPSHWHRSMNKFITNPDAGK